MSDPIQIAMESERQGRMPAIYPKKFYNKYKEQADGTQKAEEWVEVAKKGTSHGQITPMRWRDVERSPDLLAVLKPFYQNWKTNETTPVVGTALESWTADAEMVEVLNTVNIRSVEDFAHLEDHLLIRLNIPGSREKQKRAKAFLEARTDTAKVSQEVANLRGENESLKSQIAELRALIERHSVKEETIKRGPGRPRKELAN